MFSMKKTGFSLALALGLISTTAIVHAESKTLDEVQGSSEQSVVFKPETQATSSEAKTFDETTSSLKATVEQPTPPSREE
jgi:hypothetical protein